MTPELEEKINNLVEILYQNEYIDGYLYNRRKIDWTDKGHDFMKEKFGDLWNTFWPNCSHPGRIWLPHITIKSAIEQIKHGTVIDSPRNYWDYVKFDVDKWEYDNGDQRYDLFIRLLGLNDIDYIELDDLIL